MASAHVAITMIGMVIRLSLKSVKKISERRVILSELSTVDQFLNDFEEAANKDAKVFRQYQSLARKNEDDPNRQKAILKATAAPLEAAKAIMEAIVFLQRVVPFCKTTLRSDLKAALLLLDANFQGILVLAEANLRLLPETSQPAILDLIASLKSEQHIIFKQVKKSLKV